MKINYELPKDCNSFFNVLQAPYVWGARHIALATDCKLNLSFVERIYHFFLGLFMCLPIFGYALAGIDRLCDRSTSFRIVHLKEKDPYQMGLSHGTQLKKQIQELYPQTIPLIHQKAHEAHYKKIDLDKKIQDLEWILPDDIKQEMQGIAKGAGVDYNDVLLVNLFIDALGSDHFGCSALAIIQDLKQKQLEKVAATNHFASCEASWAMPNSKRRLENLLTEDYKDQKLSCKAKLKAVDRDNTIQAIIFDSIKGKVFFSGQSEHAAQGPYQSIPLSDIFTKNHCEPKDSMRIKLMRTLDYPYGEVLNNYTTFFVHHEHEGNEFFTIGWPGFLAPPSGMNQYGLSFAMCASENKTEIGTPNFIAFREMLKTCKTVNEALEELRMVPFAASMNLVLSGSDGIASLELDPSREETGPAHLTHTLI